MASACCLREETSCGFTPTSLYDAAISALYRRTKGFLSWSSSRYDAYSLRMMPRRVNIEGANSLGYDCDPPMLRATSLTRNTILDGRVFRSSEHLTRSHCASRLGLHLEKRSGISRRIAPVYQLYTSRDASHMLEIWRLSSEEVGLTHNGSRPNFRTAWEREFVSHSAYAFPPLRAMHGGGADDDK